MSKRCLVTGGAGFIGSGLVKELVSQGWNVEIVDDLSSGFVDLLDMPLRKVTYEVPCRTYFDFKQLCYGDKRFDQIVRKENKVLFMHASYYNIDVIKCIEMGRYDVIFHQAAIPRVSYSVEEPIKTLNVNLVGTCVLLKAAADTGTPVVFASSSSVYGGSITLPTTELDVGQCAPLSPYAMQKLHTEHYATLFGELYNLRSIGLRYFNVFGPGQRAGSPYATAVAAWCHEIKSGGVCRSDGDGEQTRDLCYIDNVVQANIKAAEKLLGGEKLEKKATFFNIACEEQTSNNEILNALSERFGDRVKIQNAPVRAGDVKHTLADITSARDILGYEPTVTFWDGFEKTLEYWELSEEVQD